MLRRMKLPSFARLAEEAAAAARRFPLALLCGVIAAVAGILLVDAGEGEEVYLRILYAASLGLPLFIGLEMVAERRDWSVVGRVVAISAGALLLLAIYLLRQGWSEDVALDRYFQLWLGLHLFVAVGPYLGVNEQNGFWQYNMSLFLRFLVATLFAVVLYFGLSIALLAIDNLFGLDVDGEWYGRLWFILAFVFHPWFFLGGVPHDFAALESRRLFPHGLKVFGQYILAPIVALYLVILTAYLGKVLVTQEWPSGWIGWLVSSVAVAGILSLLLLRPIEETEENRWVRTYARWFWVALIPSIGMLLAAIWKRIDQYGVTERRYFLVVLSLWLAGIALFYIVRRRGSLKVIPATLAVGAFVTLAGPWGAYAVSERSQVDRLREILARNGMLADGRISAPATEPTFQDRREMSAVVRYLVGTHDVEAIEPWFESGLADVDTVGIDPGRMTDDEIETRTESIVARMGVGYVNRWAGMAGDEYNLQAVNDAEPLDVSGRDWAVRDWSAWGERSDSLTIDGRSYELSWDAEAGTITLADAAGALVTARLEKAVESARSFQSDSSAAPGIPARILTVRSRGERARLTVYLSRVSGSGEGIDSFSADLFFTLDPAPDLEGRSPDTTAVNEDPPVPERGI
jgi:hypothetical protein